MRRCEDEKMIDRPSQLEERCDAPGKKGKRMETNGNKMKQSNCQDVSIIFYKSIKSNRLTSNTWSL